MNWGWKIAIVYSVFVVLTLGAVFYVVSTQDVELVTKEYYKEEIQYQQVIDAKKRNNELEVPIAFELNKAEKKGIVKVPTELLTDDMSANIVFYRPSNSADDKHIDLEVDSIGMQEILLNSFRKGIWKLRITVISSGNTYIVERELFI